MTAGDVIVVCVSVGSVAALLIVLAILDYYGHADEQRQRRNRRVPPPPQGLSSGHEWVTTTIKTEGMSSKEVSDLLKSITKNLNLEQKPKETKP